MRKIGFIILLLFAICPISRSQQSKINGLSKKLQAHVILDSVRVDILNEIAFEYLHKNPNILREYIKESQRITENIEYPKGKARSLSILASSFWVEAGYSIALDYYLQALKIYNEIDDKTGIYWCNNNIGEIYKKIENYELALIYHEQSLDLKNKYLPDLSPCLSYINIGEIYLKTNGLDLAKEYFEKALILSVEEKNTRRKAYAYAGLGQYYFKIGEIETAVFHMEQSFDIREKSEDILGMIQSDIAIADAYYSIKHLDIAEDHYSSAQQRAKVLGAGEYEKMAYKGLFNVDSSKGNYKKALVHNARINHLNDSLFTLAKEKQLARIKTIYDVEQKDKQNALLIRDNEAKLKMLSYQRLINIGGSIVLVVLIVMSVALFRHVKKQKKIFGLLQEKNAEVKVQRDKLLANAKKLKELNENLEKTVRDRTGIILKKNEKLREFAYMNAHNVRGPLSNILGLTYLLKKQDLGVEQKELVSNLDKSAEKLDSEFHQLRTHMEDEERS